MIYDCFSFFNELDVLEIRLNTLDEVVDKFVLVEAAWTHTGKPKPLHFEENKQRFAPFLDKIIHIVVSDADLPTIPTGASDRDIAWIRENVQRNAIVKGLSAAKPDDVILISDLDEIPDPEKIKSAAANPIGITNFQLRNYAYYLNYRNISLPFWSNGPKLLSMGTFLNPATYSGIRFSEYVPECANPVPSASLIRFAKNVRNLKSSGWHFSFMGGLDAIKTKLRSYSHTEHAGNTIDSDANIARCLENGLDLFGYGERFVAEPLTDTFPKCLRDGNRYTQHLLSTDEATYHSTRFRRFLCPLRKHLHDFIISTGLILVPKSLHPLFRILRKKIGM